MQPVARFAGEDRRLHPATLALAVLRLGPQALNLIPALVAIGVTGGWRWVAPALLLFLLLSLAFSWVHWMRFVWRVDHDDLSIASGILARNHRTIPFDRIQDVNIEQGMLHRLLGLAKVGIETGAGSGKDEGALDAISAIEARALRDHIRAHRTQAAASAAPALAGATPATPALPASEEERALFAMTPHRLFTAGLFNFSLTILAVLFGALQWFDDLLPFDPFSVRFWVDVFGNLGLEQWILAHRWLAAAGGMVGLLLLGMVTGIARMVLANWDFRLTRTERGLRRTRGLTTRTDVVVPLARIQGAVVSSGPISRRLGWHSLSVQSLASDGEKESDHVVAPFARLSEIDGILTELGLDRADGERAQAAPQLWQRVAPVEMAWGIGFAALLAALALSGLPDRLAALVGDADGALIIRLAWLPLLLLALLIGGVTLLDWRARRWRFDGRVVHIISGALRRQHLMLPARHVQSADLSVGPLGRAAEVRRLTLGVAGATAGQHSIPALPKILAQLLRAQLLAAR